MDTLQTRQIDRLSERPTAVRRRFAVQGVVQGVGFRPFVHGLALRFNLGGWVRNASCGVEMELQGRAVDLSLFEAALIAQTPPLARVMDVQTTDCLPEADVLPGIVIAPSRSAEGRTLISPDVATCPQCLLELFDPSNRRYGYAFTNCTHCGPRFTIIEDLPYDRPRTTMAAFALCAACEREYRDAQDRRFHAQPVACPTCGPVVWYTESGAADAPVEPLGADAICAAVVRLDAGGIIGVRGLGGFHLCCRADRVEAVARLRASKFRPSKPLAVMVRHVADAKRFCYVNAMEAELLEAPEAPIVLLRKKGDGLASDIAPGNGYLGVMLPYTPLHHLLVAEADGPLVMTSGNPAGEPLCIDNREALARLGRFADGFLFHNRPIARRCDDSVMMVVKDGERARLQPVRRSRGLAPLPVLLPPEWALSHPVLAAGADLKNVSAVGAGRQVFLSAHVGDLRQVQVREELHLAVRDLKRLFRIAPECAVCDLHPDYASAQFAQAEAEKGDLPLLAVQHHHAHIAGCMAENAVIDRTIGLSFDGTGYGTDGCIWGGEALVCDGATFDRVGHLSYMPLPGGDGAIGKPYRAAIAYVHEALPEHDMERLFPDVPHREVDLLLRMAAGRVNTPLTSSAGRLFDAVSALLGLACTVTHEAQGAMALEDAALGWDGQVCGYDVQMSGGIVQVGPMLDGILQDLERRCAPAFIALRFHRTMADAAVGMAEYARASAKLNRVALSGGVWQNRLLLGMTVSALARRDFEVLIHHSVPANDGGIAYGQAAVAAARMARGLFSL